MPETWRRFGTDGDVDGAADPMNAPDAIMSAAQIGPGEAYVIDPGHDAWVVGFYYIVDRSKDMIVRGGFNVYPRELEEVPWSTRRSRWSR